MAVTGLCRRTFSVFRIGPHVDRVGAANARCAAANPSSRAPVRYVPDAICKYCFSYEPENPSHGVFPVSNRFGRSSDLLRFRRLPDPARISGRDCSELRGSFTAAGLFGICTRFPFHPFPCEGSGHRICDKDRGLFAIFRRFRRFFRRRADVAGGATAVSLSDSAVRLLDFVEDTAS